MDAKLNILKQEVRRQFNRKLLVLIHAVAAFVTAIIYLNELNLGRLQYSRRGAGVAVLILAAPALVPYIISAVHSWRTVTYNRLRVAAFIFVFIAGAIATSGTIVGAFGLSLQSTDLLWVFAMQAALYFFSAEFLFDVD
jgi:uncharacterized membrane protein